MFRHPASDEAARGPADPRHGRRLRRPDRRPRRPRRRSAQVDDFDSLADRGEFDDGYLAPLSAPRSLLKLRRTAIRRTSAWANSNPSRSTEWRQCAPTLPVHPNNRRLCCGRQSRHKTDIGNASHHRVLPCRLAKPRGAQLGRPLLRLEVDVDDPEAVAATRRSTRSCPSGSTGSSPSPARRRRSPAGVASDTRARNMTRSVS